LTLQFARSRKQPEKNMTAKLIALNFCLATSALFASLTVFADTIPDEYVLAFIAALDLSRPSWIRDLDTMTTAIHLEPSDVLNVLGDLWRRVEADNVR